MSHNEIIIRLLVAVLIGGLIGYEREYKQRPAGFRTHVLVCVAAAVVSMIQLSIGESVMQQVLNNESLKEVLKIDYGRLGAQVITGVGFLGAGTIIHLKGSVKGLTTAATIWTVACIGLAVGLGYYFLATTSALIIFITLIIFKKFEDKLIYKKRNLKLYIEFYDGISGNKELCKYFEELSIDILHVTMSMENHENKIFKFEYAISVPSSLSTSSLISNLSLIKETNYCKVLC
ncbi:MgtC/SapB family protein [Clostridium sp.]|uniref:MgtC/SapB family protein n=1 Tax=Clostridium sp. TaxID=1506 RepID=UPI002FCA3789